MGLGGETDGAKEDVINWQGKAEA
ncbi:Protein of unknown function [Pyronema omphalodes CBS 100304]|uniref:Uncharacterized protein n=1 Tax=Pyronema omphalodes (strain CBS 100304) TaxID=1076935 RepID=U4KUL7_PYROM|nr:Protein of unknown function [Pyronema omphalodes CBS 100304]